MVSQLLPNILERIGCFPNVEQIEKKSIKSKNVKAMLRSIATWAKKITDADVVLVSRSRPVSTTDRM